MSNKLGFAGEVSSEMFQQYLDGDFDKCVNLCNTIAGKGLTDFETVEQAVTLIVNQSKRVLEEIREGMSHIETVDTNEKALLDDVVDILFVGRHYANLIQAAEAKFGDDTLYGKIEEHRQGNLVYLASQIFLPSLSTFMAEFSYKRIMIACQLVCTNNTNKFTKDLDIAAAWQMPEDGCSVKSKDVDGETWYAIIRESDGKFMKHVGFQEVNLEFI